MRPVLLSLLLVACGTKDVPPAVNIVSLCTPGKSFTKCHEMLEHDRAQAKPILPAGDLGSIFIDGAAIVVRSAPTLTPSTRAYRYTLYFREASSSTQKRVLPVLEAQLGPGTTIKGSPPIADPACPSGDYWVAADGIWILNDASVTWYSKPIEGVGPNDQFPWADKYVQNVPASAALWNKLGQLLVTR